ncbi:MAG TPA: D-alanyl-D-alanine carboxypeptidase family protein [Ilumatobacteraceae bacterium]|nr:D-alanyl-D-alanine carboxypeptidase family protein [Ilumatobacteraceae bacterium]
MERAPLKRVYIGAALLLLAACGSSGGSATIDTFPPLAVPATIGSTVAAATTTLPPPPPPTAAPTTIATTIPAAVDTAVDTAVDGAKPPAIDADAYVVYDVDSQKWLAGQDADTAKPVGSLMKLLTAYVVMQAGDPTHVATVPPMQLDPAESAIGLYEGQRLSREILLRAELIVSANDASRTLALDVGGSEEAFVAKMNEAAQSLGMSQTAAVNSVGLDAEGAHSSARDMVSLATILMQDPTFRATVARTDARMNGQHFNATNKLLTSYDGATGVKTGHTTAAGYCLVGSATRDGRSVIVAVLGAPTDKARIDGASTLLDWAFSR